MPKLIVDMTVLSDDERQIIKSALPEVIKLYLAGMLRHSTCDLIAKDISDFTYLKEINERIKNNGNN